MAKLRKVARKRFYEDRIRYTNDTNSLSGGTTSKCYLVYHSSQQSLASVLANGSILVDKQLANVIVDLYQKVWVEKSANQVKDYRERRIWLNCGVSNILVCREIIFLELMLFSTVLVRNLSKKKSVKLARLQVSQVSPSKVPALFRLLVFYRETDLIQV